MRSAVNVSERMGTMGTELHHNGMLTIVDSDLEKVERRVKSYRRQNTYLVVGGLIASTLAMLLAGGTAAGGPAVVNQVGGWRLICTIVAASSGMAAVVTGLHDRLKVGDHLANAMACSAQLGALKFSLQFGNADAKSSQDYYRTIIEKYRYYMV